MMQLVQGGRCMHMMHACLSPCIHIMHAFFSPCKHIMLAREAFVGPALISRLRAVRDDWDVLAVAGAQGCRHAEQYVI